MIGSLIATLIGLPRWARLALAAVAALAIVGIGTLFYGLENTTRAFKLSVSAKGVEVDAGEEGGQ